MAREKIVITSDNFGSKDIVDNFSNGLLFKNGDSEDFAEKINFVLDSKNKKDILKIEKNAKKTVEKFKWKKLILKLNHLIEDKTQQIKTT